MAFIAHFRGAEQLDLASLSDDPETAGDEVRAFLADHAEDILPTDTIVMSGEADFGDTYTLLLPPAIYRGPTLAEDDPPARWLTHTRIDRIGPVEAPLKPGGSAGITFTSYVRFENFYLGGAVSDIHEDGGLLGWPGSYTGHGVAEFVNCEIDASGGMDWGIYSWQNSTGIQRTVRITDSIVRFCRFGVALSGSGWQSAELIRVQGFGNANGSQSYGTSSSKGTAAGDDGAVLTLVYNRGQDGAPYIRMVDCHVEAIGLTAPYNSGWGCPRIAALATNCYERGLNHEANHPTTPNEPNLTYLTGHTSYFLGCSTDITPGISEEVYDIDIRERSGTPIVRELSSPMETIDMASTVLFPYPAPSLDIYFRAIDKATQECLNVGGESPEFEAYDAGNWEDYAIAVTDANGIGLYAAEYPEGAPAGAHLLLFYLQDGASPAASDEYLVAMEFEWGGSAEVTLYDLLMADRVVDTGVTPWALVLIKKGTGALGSDGAVELLRQSLRTADNTAVTSDGVVVGKAVSA